MTQLTNGLLLAGLQATLFGLLVLVVVLAGRQFLVGSVRRPLFLSFIVLAVLTVAAFFPLPGWLHRDSIVRDDNRLAAREDAIDKFGLPTESEPRSGVGAIQGGSSAGEMRLRGSDEKQGLATAFRETFAAFLDELLTQSGGSEIVVEGRGELTWRQISLVVVSILIGIGLARLTWASWELRRLAVESKPLDDLCLRELIASISTRCGLRVPPLVVESSRLASAATFGWRRPTILLPSGWRKWNYRQLEAAVAHEIAHILHGDFAGQYFARICSALYFYHPVVHWMASRLQLEQELAADDRAAELIGNRTNYLKTLAELALAQDRVRLSVWAPMFLPRPRMFARRIEMLQLGRIQDKPRQPAVNGLFALAILVFGFVCVGLRWTDRANAVEDVSAPSVASQEEEGGATEFARLIPENCAAAVSFRVDKLRENPVVTALGQHYSNREWKPLDALESELRPLAGVELEDIARLTIVSSMRDMQSEDLYLVELKSDAAEVFKAIESSAEDTGTVAGKNFASVYARSFSTSRRQLHGVKIAAKTLAWSSSLDLLDELVHRTSNASRGVNSSIAKQSEKDVVVFVGDEALAQIQSLPNDGSPMTAWTESLGLVVADAQDAVLGCSLDSTIRLEILANMKSSDGAQAAVDKTKNLIAALRKVLQSMERQSVGHPNAEESLMAKLPGWGLEMLNEVQIKSDGNRLTASSTLSVDSDELVAAITDSLDAIRVASQRNAGANNLKYLALAMHNYHDAHQSLPPAVLVGPDGKTEYSWRIAILPFIGEPETQRIYDAYRFDEPWNSEHNRKVTANMPDVFRHPNDAPDSAFASYFALVGPETVFDGQKPCRLQDITDGTSNTIMLVESKRDVNWAKPEDIRFDPKTVLKQVGGFNTDGVSAAFGDGSVRFLSTKMPLEDFVKMVTKAGGEVIGN